MAHHFDTYDNSLVIDGWEKGVAENPYAGLADMRNMNIVPIPGEVSVNFATSQISSTNISGTITVTSLNTNAIGFAAVTGLENGMAIQFTNVGSLTGVSLNTTYWVYSSVGSPVTSVKLYATYSDYSSPSGTVAIGGSAGGATFTVLNIGNGTSTSLTPAYFAFDGSHYYMQDGNGLVWSNIFQSGTFPNQHWTFTGFSGTSDSSGCGLVYFNPDAVLGGGFIFSFLSNSVDFFDIANKTWTWGWNFNTGATHQSGYMHSVGGFNLPHEAQVAPNSVLYFCDGNWLGQIIWVTGSTFSPTNTATYAFTYQKALIQSSDTAISLSYIASNILIGGTGNIIYNWNGIDSFASSWIFLPEFYVKKMVALNSNVYIFAGNRGRIYVTTGSNVQLYKKVPDHISGTVEPYFTWGGACTFKNQLYFGLMCLNNAGTNINQYGGLWAIDTDTNAIRLTNQLSYTNYSGYASAIIPNFGLDPSGTGLYIGWMNLPLATPTFGIDTTIGTPYTTSVATVDTDLIPIGTYNKPRDFTQVEYKLTRPLVSGESITIKSRLIFNTTDTGFSAAFLSDSTVGHFSGKAEINLKNAQWVQFQVTLNSTATAPSYVRLKEIRILGLVKGVV